MRVLKKRHQRNGVRGGKGADHAERNSRDHSDQILPNGTLHGQGRKWRTFTEGWQSSIKRGRGDSVDP